MKKCCAWIVALLCLIGCGEAKQGEAQPDSTPAAEKIVQKDKTLTNEQEQEAFAALPEWFREAFKKQQLQHRYSLGTWMQPNFLTGDFDGDQKEDVAFLAVNMGSGEKGLIILHQDAGNSYSVFGAGNEFEEMRDMDWIGILEKVEAGETVVPTLVDEETGDILGEDTANAVLLKADAVFLHQKEACGGGIIYKKDKHYNWLTIE
jgi:hypothetical protein